MSRLSVDDGIAAFTTIFSQIEKSPIKHFVRWLREQPNDFWIEKNDEYILCYNLQALKDVAKAEGLIYLTIERDSRRLQPIHFELYQSSHGGKCKKIRFTKAKPRVNVDTYVDREPASKKSKVRVLNNTNDAYENARKALTTAIDGIYLYPIMNDLELLDRITTQNLAPPDL